MNYHDPASKDFIPVNERWIFLKHLGQEGSLSF